MLGQSFGHYRVETKLGEGGMGVVYKALDTHLDRPVAIKVLPHERIADPDRKRRFVQEAKAASALNHPNIVHIYDIDEASGVDFIAMEYVDGKTLDELIARRGLRATETLKYAAQIADALANAHAAGIVHRDIKPSNLMVTGKGLVKILDFGLAKLSEQIESDQSAPTQTMRTQTEEGAIIGTAAYMSPEQAEGRKLDGRSDIFSFGSVLYEMVTGRRPFTGESKLSILSRILTEDPTPPGQLASSIPPGLEKIILRCLRKDPARRYQTMADLKVALEDVEAESSSSATTAVRRVPVWRRWAWVALVPVLLVTAYFAWRGWQAPQNIEPLRAMPLTTFPGLESSPSFSPDGNHVVFTWSGPKQENQDIYVQQIGSGRPLPRTSDPKDDYNPVWSPDGKHIAFFRSVPTAPTGFRNRELLLIPSLGGPELKIADIRSQDFMFAIYLAWAPDSKWVIVTDSQGEGKPDALFAVSVETREKKPLTNPQPPAVGDMSPAVSPDGRSLAFLRRTSWVGGEIHVLLLGTDMSAGQPRRLTTAELRADHPAWLPDGKEIVFSAKFSLWRMAVSGRTAPIRLAYVGEDGMMPAISRPQTGQPARLVYVRLLADENFWRLETSGPGVPVTSAPVSAIASSKTEYHIQFSPDGRRVAFTSFRSGDPEIWLADPDGSNASKLTSLAAYDTNCPRWSPDGQTIAFSSTAEGDFDVYTVPAGGGKPKRLTTDRAMDLCPKYSPDGNWLYFSSMRTGDFRIWKMPAIGGNADQVSTYPAGSPDISKDGRDMYYNGVSVVSPVWRVPMSGGMPVRILDGMLWFNFALLEKGAYFIDGPAGDGRLQYVNFATGKTTTVARNLGHVRSGLTATADGKTILFTRIDSSADDLMLVENFR